MPCAPAAQPEREYHFAKLAGINVDRLTREEAEEVDRLVGNAGAGLPILSGDVVRLCDLRRKAAS